MRPIWQRLGPVTGAVPQGEVARAALGAAIGILMAGLVVALTRPWNQMGMIGPFGASAVLIFAVPGSPLAQPFSVVIGNTSAALVALLVAWLLPWPLAACSIALGLSIVVNAALRATHPPSGGIAVLVGLTAGSPVPLPPSFALTPVLAGSLALVGTGLVYHKLTRRSYPLP